MIVASPGSLPWMTMTARQLAADGLLSEYVTTLVRPTGKVRDLVARLPHQVRRAVNREIMRRGVIGHIDDELIHQTAPLLESLVVVSGRLSYLQATNGRFVGWRDSAFDRQAARRLRADHSAFVGSYGTARRSLRRANDIRVRSYLNYAHPHHDFVEAILTDEARLRPEYADDLKLNVAGDSGKRQLDEEIGLADRIFVLSSFQKRTLVDAGVPDHKLILTPLGVDLDLFQDLSSPRDQSTFRVIFVGQITQRKGISYLFDAFAQADIPRSELLLVGRPVGAGRPWDSVPRVRHIGHVPRRELPALYSTADVFVLPSLAEGFGLTSLEAMACGLPVIISENTFGADVVTDGVDGYVVPIRDPEAIAARIVHLHEHPDLRARMRVAARRRAEEFSWERYGKAVVGAISETWEPGPRA